MAVRLKTRWHRSRRSRRNIEGSGKAKTVEDLAGVIAFNIWKLAHETFRHMDKEGFTFSSDDQVMAVITEVLAFLTQITDRMVYGKLSDEERARFINEVAQNLVRTAQANQEELYGPGDYAAPFVEILNARFAEYAECDFNEREGPGYAFRRLLGEKVSAAMAASDNKWVIEHVIDVESPEAVKAVQRMVTEVMGLRRYPPSAAHAGE